MRSFIHRVPSGSRPDVGSSRMTRSGSLMSACARPMRCRMPFEYSFRMRFLSAPRPTISISSAERFRRVSAGMSNRRP